MNDHTNRLPMTSAGVATMSDEQLIQQHRNLTDDLRNRGITVTANRPDCSNRLAYTKVFK